MKHTKYITITLALLVGVFVLFTFNCSDDDGDSTTKPKTGTTTGTETGTTTGTATGTTSGSQTGTTTGSNTQGIANSIYVDGTDIYVAGVKTQNFVNSAAYWKNGTISDLSVPSSTTYSSAESVVVSGGNVYVAGSYFDGSKNYPCYWKDGIRHDISITQGGSLSDIYIDGSDVYVCGNYFENSLENGFYAKNDTLTLLEGYNTMAKAIDVNGTNVFVTGVNDYYSSGSLQTQDACYWIDGTKYSLDITTSVSGTVEFSDADGIVVKDSNTIYVSGMYRVGNSTVLPCYWEVTSTNSDGSRTDLSGFDSSGIFLDNTDLYVVGTENHYDVQSQTSQMQACYWLNGNNITNISNVESHGHDIFVSSGSVYVCGYRGNYNDGIYPCYWINNNRTDL